MKKRLIYTLSCSLTIIFMTGCTVKIPVNEVIPSKHSFLINKKSEKSLALVNGLQENHTVETGIFKKVFLLHYRNQRINGYNFVKENLEKELSARSLPLSLNAASHEKIVLDDFSILTYRKNAYVPTVTLSTLKLTYKNKPIVSLVKRAKFQVAGVEPIIDACYNDAITILFREAVAKLNKTIYGFSLDNSTIQKIQNKIDLGLKNKDNDIYKKVYALGFSNNKNALPFLLNLVDNPDEYVRIASIGTLGLLGGETYLKELVNIYYTSKYWSDKLMALKSIGDIQTTSSIHFLQQEKQKLISPSSIEEEWYLNTINLYLE
ncbi:HEAT repeat domain-containing protein [Candidatus Marinarcus aquaticus]|uniref:HEAT repeat domain-containing protein n=1 Tax=Candidatus Marinarcus aquaticus TaxID=2044504 RepID=UPI00100C2EBE|nr:HEAT repeat domain-containing protein [Candidatus Marinarcus aquaticus]